MRLAERLAGVQHRLDGAQHGGHASGESMDGFRADQITKNERTVSGRRIVEW